jgi:phosphatidylglycerol:prolipoprotein diacylglycerol transferase
VIFSIGPFAPRWYGLVYLCGFLYLYYWMRRESRWLGLKSQDQVDSVLGWLILSMILGSRATFVLVYNFEAYKESPWWEIFAVWHGGLSFHGGIFGVMLGSYFVARAYGIKLLRLWDMLMLSTPLAIGFGRITNFINGELWGRPTDVPWAMVFPGAGPEPRHPSQLYQAVLEGFLFYVVVLILWKKKARQGVIAGVFGIWYSVARSIGELFREPDRQLGFFFGGLTMGQLLSFGFFFVGVTVFIYALRRPLDENEERELALRGTSK